MQVMDDMMRTKAIANAPDSPIDHQKKRKSIFGIDKAGGLALPPQASEYRTGVATRHTGSRRSGGIPNSKSWGNDDIAFDSRGSESARNPATYKQIRHSSITPSSNTYYDPNTPSPSIPIRSQNSSNNTPSSGMFTGVSKRNIAPTSSKRHSVVGGSSSSSSSISSTVTKTVDSFYLPPKTTSTPTKIIPGKSLQTQPQPQVQSRFGPKDHIQREGTPYENDSRRTSSFSKDQQIMHSASGKRISNENRENLNAKSSSSSHHLATSSEMQFHPFKDPSIHADYSNNNNGYKPLCMEAPTPRSSTRRRSRNVKREPEVIDLLSDDDTENALICKYMLQCNIRFCLNTYFLLDWILFACVYACVCVYVCISLLSLPFAASDVIHTTGKKTAEYNEPLPGYFYAKAVFVGTMQYYPRLR